AEKFGIGKSTLSKIGSKQDKTPQLGRAVGLYRVRITDADDIASYHIEVNSQNDAKRRNLTNVQIDPSDRSKGKGKEKLIEDPDEQMVEDSQDGKTAKIRELAELWKKEGKA